MAHGSSKSHSDGGMADDSKRALSAGVNTPKKDVQAPTPHGNNNDTGMFYGLKLYNDLLMEAGPFGNMQSEVLMRKDDNTFTFSQGWAFLCKIYFNGDECKMPPPDSYPYLPNSASLCSSIITAASTLPVMVFVFVHLQEIIMYIVGQTLEQTERLRLSSFLAYETEEKDYDAPEQPERRWVSSAFAD
uniref:COBRA C-terminal domain-containing protein n=1 Tax=Aegilops tauschii TaxID=37682 RepID=R7W7Q6_AEGTA